MGRLWKHEFLKLLLKLINYSSSSYPTRSSYSGQVDWLRNSMKNELETTACLEIISHKAARKTHDDKQLYLIKHFTKHTFKPKLFTADVKFNSTVIKLPKTEKPILFLNINSRSMVVTLSFGSLSTLLYTSDLKWH